MKVEEFTEKLRGIILKRIESDRLPLPSMPDVAPRCMDIMREQDVDIVELSQQVERDPLLTACVMRLSNSAASGGSIKSSGVQSAVTRVGLERMKGLLIQLSSRQVYHSRDKRIGETFRLIWEHSVAVAILARDLAVLLGNLNCDVAYQAGLIHDLGKPIVGVMLLEAEKMMTSGNRRMKWMSANEWLQVVSELHRPVAVALAKKWELPKDVTATLEEAGDYDPSARQSVTNVVRFANAVAKQKEMYPGEINADEIETMIMVGSSLVGIKEHMVDRIAADLEGRVAAVITS